MNFKDLFRDLPEYNENEHAEVEWRWDEPWEQLLLRIREGLEDCAECGELATDVQFGQAVCEACKI